MLDELQRIEAETTGTSNGSRVALVMLVLHSLSDDPWCNLAMEIALMEGVAEYGACLLFYVNRAAIIIGKNQNPWQECRVDQLKRDGVPLLRRSSGGGAVWHDPGNLNYAFIVPRKDFDRDRLFDVILDALRSLGVEAERSEAHGLAVGGRKISGNAFCFRKDAVLHHGTLLIKADLQRLEGLLRPVFQTLETRAVASRPACTGNLCDHVPGLTIHQAAMALKEAARRVFHSVEEVSVEATIGSAWRPHAEVLRSWEWSYGLTPPFTLTLDLPDNSPSVLQLRVEEGRVSSARVQKENLNESMELLLGVPFDAGTLANRLQRDSSNGWQHSARWAKWLTQQGW